MEFAKKIVETTEEIFNTMIFMEVSAEAPLEQGKQALGCHVSAMIGLSGGFSAMLGIHCPETVGLAISGAMLGMEIEEIDADVKDALGEIANMVAGGLKERFSAEDIDLELAIPTAISGKSYTIASSTRSNRVIIPFSVDQGQFFIEMKYNLN
ncbi:MAG: chemotaxis protein CheX [Thermodesulfobacteriota bacterium]|nr:chemotaxis protein CheX [Thermodesulfobacteriota bacterium]